MNSLSCSRILCLISLVMLLGQAESVGQLLQIPCKDPRGCPDLILADNRLGDRIGEETFSETDCALVEGFVGSAGTRRLLRFTTIVPNIGVGDLVVGSPTAPENASFFTFSPCHRHYHFNAYAAYRLWTTGAFQQWQLLRQQFPDALSADLLTQYPSIASGMVAGHKMAFCIADVIRFHVPGLSPPGPAKYSCANQGISTGWADVYDFRIEGQWIDVTDVPPGEYVLEVEANPQRLLQESNYRNNAGWEIIDLKAAK